MISINNGMLINSKIPCIIFRREEGRGKKEEGEEREEREEREEGRNNETQRPLDTKKEENFPISLIPIPQSPFPKHISI
jgi:hypothetical protein